MESAFNPEAALAATLDVAPNPALAPLVKPLPDMPVKLDNAPAGAEAPDEASPAAVPAADDDPGVASPCRACGTEEINRIDVDWTLVPVAVPAVWASAPARPASPPGLVVWGGGVKVVKADAEAELAA